MTFELLLVNKLPLMTIFREQIAFAYKSNNTKPHSTHHNSILHHILAYKLHDRIKKEVSV